MIDYYEFTRELDEEIGKRLRLQRIEHGISQVELAKKLGITFQQIQKYELGKNRISAGRLVVAAKVLNVPLSVFTEGIENSPPDDYKHFLYLSKYFAKIEDKKVKRRLAALVRTLAGAEEAEDIIP